MKRLLISLFILLFSSHIIMGQSIVVSNDEAVQATENWIRVNHPQRETHISIRYILRDSIGNPIIYEMTTDSTTILLSGNKNCKPILGYCGEEIQPLLHSYIQKTLPCGLQSIISEYIAQIKSGYKVIGTRNEYRDSWQELLNGNNEPTRPVATVGPLLNSLWSQRYPNYGDPVDAYNYYAPPDANGPCEHCLAGCVAVAMAQVMYYWKHPVITLGTTEQYDWCWMSPYLNTNTTDYEKRRNAIAYLIRDCGRRLDMNYGCNGSGAQTSRIRDILVGQLNYNENAVYRERSDYSPSQWTRMLKDEIDTGRLVIYRGSGTGSHAFVCDGYNENGYFHFNWGWGGTLTNNYNGYFSIEQITVGSYDFTLNQAAIFHIKPKTIQDYCDITLDLGDYYRANIIYLLFHSPLEIVPQTMAKLISANLSSSALWRTIPTGATATYHAHEEIELRDGFIVEEGADFTAEITPCPNCEDRNVREEARVLTSEEGEIGQNETPLFLGNMNPLHISVSSATLYPNPTSGELTMAVEGEVQTVLVYNAMGAPVDGWQLRSILDDGRVVLDVKPLSAGIYLLTIRTADGKLHTGRFVRR